MNSVNFTTGVVLNILIVNTVTKNVEDSWVVGLTIPVNVMNVWELRMKRITISVETRDINDQHEFSQPTQQGRFHDFYEIIDDESLQRAIRETLERYRCSLDNKR